VWGALIVGLADNFLSVVFLKNKIKVHPLIVLFSILGGVEVFGAIGFLVGPVVVSAFIALLNIYPFIMLSYKKKDLML
jgi:predicted PurR-regulated permease PerM